MDLFVLLVLVMLIVWVISGVVAVGNASSKGEPILLWVLSSLILGPMALVLSSFAGNSCPACKKKVHRTAIKCPYCQSELQKAQSLSTPSVISLSLICIVGFLYLAAWVQWASVSRGLEADDSSPVMIPSAKFESGGNEPEISGTEVFQGWMDMIKGDQHYRVQAMFTVVYDRANQKLEQEIQERRPQINDLIIIRSSTVKLSTLEGIKPLAEKYKDAINHLLINGSISKVIISEIGMWRVNLNADGEYKS